MDFDIRELRQLTHKAKIEGETLRQKNLGDDAEAEQNRHEVAKLKAEQLAKNIPSLCRFAATKGHNKVLVTDTKGRYGAVVGGAPYNTFKGWVANDDVGLKCFYLEQILKTAKIPYSIEFQHDGIGVESWFEIHIKWD